MAIVLQSEWHWALAHGSQAEGSHPPLAFRKVG